jgi:hypothetical protein
MEAARCEVGAEQTRRNYLRSAESIVKRYLASTRKATIQRWAWLYSHLAMALHHNAPNTHLNDSSTTDNVAGSMVVFDILDCSYSIPSI